MEENRAIIRSIDAIVFAFKKNRAMELRILANNTVISAVKQNSKIFAELSVVAYVLHKILTKEHIAKARSWPRNRARILSNLDRLALYLKRDDIDRFEGAINSIHSDIDKIDNYFGRFVQSTVDKARIKHAADAYFLGASLGQASELFGADKKTLLEYIGATKFYDKEKPLKGIGERLSKLKEAIGV
ncbi:MAG: hypothetical protein N3F05_02140 [Candidatus Diapherotrites archaeon]|nr:hypothetical protein [Candidatus Diapherotrites archaeon]